MIDDDPGVRESVSLNLEDSGFDVIAFEGGPSALAWFARGETADLIVQIGRASCRERVYSSV